MIRHWSDKRGSNTRPWILDFFHGPIWKEKRICWKNTHLPYNLYFQSWRKKGFLFSIFYVGESSVAHQSAGAWGDWRMGRRMMVLREGGAWRELLVKFELIRLLPSLQLIIHWHNTGTLTWYNADGGQIELTLIDRMNRFEILVRMAIWIGSI